MIKLQNTKGGYVLNVPTSKKDLDFNSIKDVVANVIPSKHYAVIALCQSFKPFNLAMLANGKDTDVKVLEKTDENILTLITCVENEPSLRRCLIAKEINK